MDSRLFHNWFITSSKLSFRPVVRSNWLSIPANKGSKPHILIASPRLSGRFGCLGFGRLGLFADQQLAPKKNRPRNQTHPLRLDAVGHPTPADPPYSMSPYTTHPQPKKTPHPTKINQNLLTLLQTKHKIHLRPLMYILDENHRPVPTNDHLAWGRFFEKTNDRTVAKTDIGNIHISTVFLGIDHSFTSPVPILFETMIFGGDLDNDTTRYATWEEAEAGHEEAEAKVRRILHATELITQALTNEKE